MHARTRAHTLAYTHVCMTCIHTQANAHTPTLNHAGTQTHGQTHTHQLSITQAHKHTHTHTHTHTHANTHTRTHTRTQARTPPKAPSRTHTHTRRPPTHLKQHLNTVRRPPPQQRSVGGVAAVGKHQRLATAGARERGQHRARLVGAPYQAALSNVMGVATGAAAAAAGV
jgi:hypothetical protein